MIIAPIQFNKIRQIRSNQKQHSSYKNVYQDSSNIYNMPFYQKPQIHSIYEDYDIAEKIFLKNLDKGRGIFGANKNIENLIQNDAIRRNVVVFFAKYSKDQIDKLDKKKILSVDELKYKADLVEVNKFFSEYESLWPESEISVLKQQPKQKVAFAGNISNDDERDCKNIVHAFSAACGLISGAMGEGAAIGADTLILRPTQFAMFAVMAAKLKVPPIPSMEYYLKEMCQGATLGVGGARLVTSWFGIAGHAASTATGTSLVTGGGSDAAITGGVRAINATLSTLITEKMGRGYIRRVKNNQMTLGAQTMELGSYLLARGIFAHENPLNDLTKIDFKDPSSPELIKEALLNMPEGYRRAVSGLTGLLAKNTVHVGELFLGDFVLSLLVTKEKDPQKIKQMASQIFKNSLIQTVSYELANTAVKGSITKEATDTIKDIQNNLEKYPEVYHMIINKEHEFFEQINLDDFGSDAFTKQFTNRTFVLNLSRFLRETIREVEYSWINKGADKNSKSMTEALKKIEDAKQKKEEIQKSFNSEEQAEYDKIMQEMKNVLSGQTDYLKQYDNFGYGRIGGYNDVKNLLTQTFITPLSLEKSSIKTNIPNSILLYGPTSVGKTQMVMAAAEQGKCKLIPIDDFESAQDLQNKLDDIFNEAKCSKRHFVIKIDEFDEFAYDTRSTEIFKKYIKNASENNVTFMFTSNDPLNIDKDILKECINIPVKPADKDDLIEVIKHYLKGLDIENYEDLAQNIIDNSNGNAFSNAQIENMCYTAMTNGLENSKEKMLQLIESKAPEISKKDIDKFYLDVKTIKDIENEDKSL